MVKLRHRAKCGGDRFYRYCDRVHIVEMHHVDIGRSVAEISSFFKSAAIRHIGFVVRVLGPSANCI